MTTPRLLYAICMILGLATGLALRPKSALPWRQRLALLAGAILGGGIGSILPFVFLGDNPLTTGGGKTILAGLAGGYLGVEVAKFLSGIREKTGDGFAVPLAAAIAVGRWGCFFNG